MHNFLTSQPDLNFHNSEVRKALLDVARFWLDKGVDGFRLDSINFYYCDKKLRDNPPLEPEKRNDSVAPAVNPYNYQDHLYDKNQPENIDFLKELRLLTNSYAGTAMVGEVGDAQRGIEILAEYTQGHDKIHMCYTFDFLCSHPPTAEYFMQILSSFNEKAPEIWVCWAFSNHDVVRHASRWARKDVYQNDFQKMLCSLLLSLKGSVCLYQGEELGFTESVVQFEDLQDPNGIEFWPEFAGRDGCRTPMVWNENEAYGGFSDVKPWLPVDPQHLQKSARIQGNDDDSMLGFYQAMLRFRHSNEVLISGDISEINAEKDVLSFLRSKGDVTCRCYFNFSCNSKRIDMSGEATVLLAPGTDVTRKNETVGVDLPPCSALYVLEKQI
jgi:alpha-glucosidase